MTEFSEAVSKAKAALDKIKIKKEKVGTDKDAHEVSKLEKPEELEAALGEAKTALDTYVLEQQRQQPVPTDVSSVKVGIDNIGLVRSNGDHVEAAIKTAKERLDELAKQHEAQQQKQ